MRAGLEVTRDNGSILLSDEYVSTVLMTTLIASQWSNGEAITSQVKTANYCDIYIPLEAGILAFEDTAGFYVCAIYGEQVGKSRRVRLYCSGKPSIKLHCFGTVLPSARGDYGLQLFKQDGSLAFDSSHKHIRVKTNALSSGGAVSLPNDGVYGVAVGSFPYSYGVYVGSVGYGYTFFRVGVRVRGGIDASFSNVLVAASGQQPNIGPTPAGGGGASFSVMAMKIA